MHNWLYISKKNIFQILKTDCSLNTSETWTSKLFLKKSIHLLWCSLFFQKITRLFLIFSKTLTGQKIVPYKELLIKHNMCIHCTLALIKIGTVGFSVSHFLLPFLSPLS